MARGIVYGRIVRPTGDAATGVRVVLDYVYETGSATHRAGGLPIEPVARGAGCMPYGVCADTDDGGRYVLLYNWGGEYIGEQVMLCRFRIMCFDLSSHTPFLGGEVSRRVVIGLDVRSLVAQLLPLDAFSGGEDSVATWANLIADKMRPFQRTSGMVRGMLGDALSTERYNIVTRIDLVTRR